MPGAAPRLPVDRRGAPAAGWPRRTEGTPLTRRGAGLLAAVCFTISGIITMLSPLLPAPQAMQRGGVEVVGTLALLAGLAFFAAPWERIPRLAAFVIVVTTAEVLLLFSNIVGAMEPFRYPLFFCVLHVLIGLSQPRWRSLMAVPATAVAYLTPFAVGAHPAWEATSVVWALPAFVIIGESIAYFGSWLACMLDEMEHQAYTDPLTGVPNRAAFYRWLEAGVAATGDGPAPAVGLVFVDLDGFKAVNDEHGHQFGDDLLCTVAQRLHGAVRPGDRIARLGGDEFVVVVEPIERGDEAALTAERILAALRRPVDCGIAEVTVSASVGVTVARRGDLEPDQLIRASDAAMYRAKRSGGDAYQVDDASLVLADAS